MGKKRKLNRLITRWIKSDLPEDRSTVLLLGVTRIPTSPTPTRRIRPLTLDAIPARDPPVPFTASRRNSLSSRREASRRNKPSRSSTRKQNRAEASGSEKSPSPACCVAGPCQETGGDNSGGGFSDTALAGAECASDVTTTISNSHECAPGPVMDRSVDSIGACSLDMEASVEFSDWSEGTSVGTLRSASLPTPSPEPRLPSYLSLACTVNGYSTTTNYDPERLARSRDTSPHRPIEHAQDNLTYTVHNSLLSPPNLVPLPVRKLNTAVNVQNNTKDMAEHTMTHHHQQEFYRSIKSMTTLSTERRNITSNLFSSDSVDSCLENGFRSTTNKCISFDSHSLTVTSSNGQNKTVAEKSVEEYSNGTETKSFIQQRVERLYGPGALAQGFFVMKRQKNRSFEVENQDNRDFSQHDKHSKSLNYDKLDEELADGGMKQSTSSPTLPVLRHLRPEFRAQLPIMMAKKESKSAMQKSVTVPRLDETKVTGELKTECVKPVNGEAMKNVNATTNGNLVCDTCESNGSHASNTVVKDGRYFLTILDSETKRLLSLADLAEEELKTPGLCEEAKGFLRSVSGKARLLVSQKMQQFRGLCTKNITQIAGEAFPTTNEDLQGFWDMVMLQVDQVDALFKQLDALRANNWQEEIETDNGKMKSALNGIAEKPRKFIKSRPVSAAAEESRKQREAQRKKLIEDRRKAMREQNKQPRQSIEIFVPESS